MLENTKWLTGQVISRLQHGAAHGQRAWAILLILLPLSAPEPLYAAGYQSHESIRQVVHSFLTQQISDTHLDTAIEVDRLDPRLRVTQCSGKLEPFLPPGSELLNTSTVGVRCQGVKPWTLYVPAKIKVFEKVVVTTRPLSRGHRINRKDIKVSRRDVATLHFGYISEPGRIVGTLAKRSIPVNGVIHPGLVEKARLVRRGQRIVIIAKAKGLEVRMQGKALMDGAEGDEVKVRNLSSNQVVIGTIAEDGTIKVHM